jgi:hypothetical protein
VSRDAAESFADFKDSFSYGARTDLTFKFLKGLDPEAASEFISTLFREVGALLDDPSPDRLIDLVYEWQVRAYQPQPDAKRPYVYEDRPFHQLDKPLSETTVGLLTSSGHYTADDPPPDDRIDLSQDEAISLISDFLRRAPYLSEIPVSIPAEEVLVRHPGYDIRSVSHDPGVALPIPLLIEADHDDRIGRLSPTAYSFVGACSQGRLRKELDEWVARWKTAGIEALFLVPV